MYLFYFSHVNVHFMKSGNLDLLFFILSPVPNQEPGFQGTFNKLLLNILFTRASQVTLLIKNLSANAEEVRDMGSIPGAGRSPGGGHGNPLHYSCLENPQGPRSLVGYCPWALGWQRVRNTWETKHSIARECAQAAVTKCQRLGGLNNGKYLFFPAQVQDVNRFSSWWELCPGCRWLPSSIGASPMAQWVKNLPAIQETQAMQFRSLG